VDSFHSVDIFPVGGHLIRKKKNNNKKIGDTALILTRVVTSSPLLCKWI